MLFFKRPMRPQNADGPATAAPASIVQARSSAVLGMPPPLPPPVAQIQQIPAAAAATAAPVGTNRDNPIEVDASRTPKSADVAQQQPQQPHQQQQQFSVAGAPDAAAPTPSLWQQQLRTSNVVLTFPIDGIERVADAYLQTIVVQVAMEIVGCEAQNLGIRAVVAEADGCVLLRVFGLSRIVAKVR